MGTNTLVSESVRRMESPMRAALLPETACHRCTTALLLSRCVRHNHFDSVRPRFEGATGVVPTSSRWCDSYLSSRQSRRQSPGLHTSSNAPCGWPADTPAELSGAKLPRETARRAPGQGGESATPMPEGGSCGFGRACNVWSSVLGLGESSPQRSDPQRDFRPPVILCTAARCLTSR